MKTIRIKANDMMAFVVPPANGGQIVEVSYSCTEDYILKRVNDQSDGSVSIVAYMHPASVEFDPWNSSPKLGRRVGVVEVVRE